MDLSEKIADLRREYQNNINDDQDFANQWKDNDSDFLEWLIDYGFIKVVEEK